MRVVASLTTIPSGVPGAIEVVQALLKEPGLDKIYLNLPKIFAKTGETYPSVEFSDPRVAIIRCQDQGPITKIYPVLDLEKDPETRILVVDDDHLPDPGVVSKFIEYSKKYPGAVLTTGGWIRGLGPLSFQEISRRRDEVIPVDWVEGSGGILAPRKFFGTREELLDYDGAGDYTSLFKKHDDHWVSWHLRNRGAKLLSIPVFFGNTQVKSAKKYNISGSSEFGAEVYVVSTHLKNIGVYDTMPSWSPSPVATKGMAAASVLIILLTYLTLKK